MENPERKSKTRVGIVGYGSLGKFLVEKIQESKDHELSFVWNRTSSKVENALGKSIVLEDLRNIPERKTDLIVEVADPSITGEFGELFLDHADYMIGSPTAFADADVEDRIRRKASEGPHGLYVPSGAFWGARDIQKMAERGTLKGLTVSMTKYPTSLKVRGELKEKNLAVKNEPVVLYSGPVRQLCPLAPNNVNTIAGAAIAAWNLGFDNVIGRLVSDPGLVNWHKTEIEVIGPGEGDARFNVKTVRMNPSDPGKVTGSATYNSFYSSLLEARGRGKGVHMC